ncbi:KTSC domain-containing protein [Litchfieldella qijiaojingensis]|uniref:KTSC domain-containing protein n=1 Tax=Litchfieldella qijiaojingensis TaxID=980347 RepID=A0ABQ2YUK7_9GAMM|nr:KTSC domain-containing protein [Halomonas qijiaojingensis]GGX95762.1 KTSC domain-containing protein [Halomonas qijiaojingensis]
MAEWVSVRSSAIREVGYDAETSRMFIDFEDSHPVYTFCGVPEAVFRELVNSGSVGRYYHQYIKDRYQC